MKSLNSLIICCVMAILISSCQSQSFGTISTSEVPTLVESPTSTNIPIIVTAQTATSITSNLATLGWTAGCSETLWNVHVTTLGGGAPTGAPSNPGVGNPFNRTGLNSNTQYEFWVSADCNAAGHGTSSWTGPFAFTTLVVCNGASAGTTFANPIIRRLERK